MPDRSLLGVETSRGEAEAIPAEMIAFSRAIGDLRPEYVDARGAAPGSAAPLLAPPTYPMRFLFDALDPDLFFALGLNLAGIVHAEQEFVYERPIRAGERYSIIGKVSDIQEKQGRSGTLDFVTFEARGFEKERNELVFTARMTLISRRLEDKESRTP